MSEWERKRILIVVRTYPAPAAKGIEVSCTAGVTDAGHWIRLFPVPYRFLDEDKRFSKYQWVDVDVQRATSDARPESHRINPDSIKIIRSVGTENAWAARKAILTPLTSHCLCCVKKAQQEHGAPTLGLFRAPTDLQFRIRREATEQWTPDELAKLAQMPLFGNAPAQMLEKVPFKFVFSFRCDDEDCTGHEVTCTDWELGQLYRRCRDSGNDWETAFRALIDSVLRTDLHFYVGTVHRYPDTWIIVGLFYPPKSQQAQLL